MPLEDRLARNSVSSKIAASGQNVTVVPVRGRPCSGAGPVAVQLGLDLAAVGELHLVVAVPVDLERAAGREGVDDADPDAVQAARDLVAPPAELAAGVQDGEGDLGRDCLVLGVRADRDAAAPSSTTRQPPSASSVTSMRVA